MSIMAKLNLFTAILATSFSVGVVKDTTLNATNFSEFTQLSNGDYSLGGRFGSITDELASYDIDILDYQMGFYGDTSLMVAVDDEYNCYFYFYDDDGFNYDYDKVSIGYYEGDLIGFDNDSLSYLEFDIQLVAFDETGHIFKYQISDFSVSQTTDYVIRIRQIYVESNKDDTEFVRGIGMLYQYDIDTGLSKLDQEETIEITKKMVAYEIHPSYKDIDGTSYEGILQRNYVAFSTNKDIDDLINVKLKYDAYAWGALTTIDFDWEDTRNTQYDQFNFSDFLLNYDLVEYVDSDSFKVLETYQDKVVSITNESYEYDYTISNNFSWLSWTGFFGDHNETYSFDTIEKTSELDGENVSDSGIYDYDWVVTFDYRHVDCCVELNTAGSILYNDTNRSNIMLGIQAVEGIANNPYAPSDNGTRLDRYGYNTYIRSFYFDSGTVADYIQEGVLYYSDPANAMLETENLTILEMTYYYSGELHTAVVVDGYNNSIGGNQIIDTEIDTSNWWDNLFDSIDEWWDSIVNSEWWTILKWVGIGIIALIVIRLVLKFLNLIISLFKK